MEAGESPAPFETGDLNQEGNGAGKAPGST